jgi:pimeloyl-ACP methyl ester carboxylesterase
MMKLEMIAKYPPNGTRPNPLLFVHGALHGAWCWNVHFLDYFARHGFASHAVNLRGHGNSEGREKLRWIRIADYVNDLADAVQKLPSPPVLIGHSLGGFVIQKYGETHLCGSRPVVVALPEWASAISTQEEPTASAHPGQGDPDDEPVPTRGHSRFGTRGVLLG